MELLALKATHKCNFVSFTFFFHFHRALSLIQGVASSFYNKIQSGELAFITQQDFTYIKKSWKRNWVAEGTENILLKH